MSQEGGSRRLVTLTSCVAALAATCLAVGCNSIAPGMGMDEGGYESTPRPGPDGGTVTYKVIPITASLIRAESAARVKAYGTAAGAARLRQALKDYQYRVGPHDVLTVTVWDHPELTIPAGQFREPEQAGRPVDAEGNVFFPYVGEVHVAGLTVDQIRALLTQKLSKYIQNAQLDVTVAGFHSQRVHVVGEVVQPGFLPVTNVPLTALEAVNLAKGFTPEADPRDVTLIRNEVASRLNLQALIDHGDLSQNRLLQDGDVVEVGDRSHNEVFVLGEVRKPQVLLMHKARMSLAEALGGANWMDPTTSNPGRIYVIRGTFDHPEIFRLDASSPDALLLAVGFPLEPMDVVYVSTYALTRWDRVISQIAPTVNTLFQAAYAAQTIRTLSQ